MISCAAFPSISPLPVIFGELILQSPYWGLPLQSSSVSPRLWKINNEHLILIYFILEREFYVVLKLKIVEIL